MRVRLAIALLLVHVSVAHADYDSEWRDGCPPGNFDRAADHLAYSRSIDDPEQRSTDERYNTDPHNTGALPDFDSAFSHTGLAMIGEYSHFAANDASAANGDVSRARLMGGILHLHVNYSLGEYVRAEGSVLAGVLDRFGGDGGLPGTTPRQWSNIALAPALRIGWLTSYIHHRTDSIVDHEGSIAALRHGVAFQLLYSTNTATYSEMDTLLLMRRSAFESYLFSPGASYGGFFEYRTEGVGCYSPFLHLRLGGFTTSVAAHDLLIFPESIAAGLSLASNTSVFFQYAVLLTVTTDESDAAQLFGGTVIHRFRAGVDFVFPHVTVGAHLDVFRGSLAYDGTVFGLYATLKPFTHGGWE